MNVLKQCIRNKKFLLSAVILVPLLFVALFGNFLISHDPLEIHYTQTLDAPSAEYPMGTDEYGRCIACRLIVGLQPTMIVAFFLGSLLEHKIRQSLTISRGDWTIFIDRPIACCFFVLTVFITLFYIVRLTRGRKAARP